MGVQVISGGEGSLEFSAVLSTDQFEKGADKLLSELEDVRKKMADLSQAVIINPKIDAAQVKSQIAEVETALARLTASGLDTGRVYHNIEEIKARLANIQPIVIPATVDTKAAFQSIETLRAKLSLRQQSLIEATDIKTVASLNKEITELKSQIEKIGNAGKEGFDEFGEKLAEVAEGMGKSGEAAEGAAGKTSLLSKGFGFLKTAAALIPGVGLAGIFNIIGEAVVALVVSLFKGSDAFNLMAAKMRLLNEVSAEANKQAATQLTNLKLEYEAATNTALATEKRLDAVLKLKTEFPAVFAQIKDEIILNGQAKGSYDALTLSILENARAEAAKGKITDIERQKLDLLNQQEKIQNANRNEKSRIKGAVFSGTEEGGLIGEAELRANSDLRAATALQDVGEKLKNLDNQEAFLSKFVNPKGIKDAAGSIDELSTSVTKFTTEYSALSAAQRKGDVGTELQKKIKAAEAELKAARDGISINADAKAERKAAADAKKDQTGLNKLIRERDSLIEKSAALERDSLQSGLIKEASSIDKINEKYSVLIKKAVEFNTKNSAALKSANLSPIDIGALKNAQAIEVRNEGFKQEAALYIKNLDAQQKAFQQYEQAKKDIGLDYANQTFGAQTKGFSSYLSYLKSETAKLGAKISLGIFNVGDAEKLKALVKETIDAQTKQAEQDYQNIQTLIRDSTSFGEKRRDIEEKFTRDFETLTKIRSKISEAEYNSRLKRLQESYDKENTDLDNQTIRQSAIYKKLNTDIIGYSRTQIKTLIKSLQTDLANGFTIDGDGNKIALSPQMIKDLEDAIQRLMGFYHETAEIFNTSVKQLDEMSKKAAEVGSIFSTLANALGPLNSGLGNALSQVSDLAGVASSAFSGISAFASGDYLAAAQSAAAVIASFGKVLADAKQSKIESKKAVTDFYAQVQAGELETNLAYRERLRTQQQINGLKLKGIEDENKELAKQRTQSLADYNRIFAELQKQQYVSGESTKKGKGSLLFGLTGFFSGLGGKTSVQQQMSDLLGMSYDQIEKLFNSGQLSNRAKELFQQLQKLKQEGIDIDKQLAELKQQQDDLFTGATVDSITDSIIEGFKNGKRSAADFADTFQELMKTAVFNALKYKTLEPLLADFYTQFAAKASDTDGLTAIDIADLQALYDEILKKTSTQFEQLAGITKLNFGASGGTGNALAGGIKAITETTAELIAGQFGGLRLTALDHLNVARQNLDISVKIERNTAAALISLASMDTTLKNLKDFGIKVKP